MKYFALTCYKCGHVQFKETMDVTKAVFKCNLCGKTRKLKYSRKYGLQLKGREFTDKATAIGWAVDQNGKDRDKEGSFRSAQNI